MRIGIFGGSFNPIHNGHIALARQLLVAAALDEVWLMVSPQNPWKQVADLLDDERRLRLARLALRDEPGLVASDYEMHLPRPSYTYNTLCHLQADYPDHHFTLLIGGDNWERFDEWHHADRILGRWPVAVYPRRGCRVDTTALPPGVTVVDAQLLDISSTDIRRRVQLSLPVGHLVPAVIERFVCQYYAPDAQ